MKELETLTRSEADKLMLEEVKRADWLTSLSFATTLICGLVVARELIYDQEILDRLIKPAIVMTLNGGIFLYRVLSKYHLMKSYIEFPNSTIKKEFNKGLVEQPETDYSNIEG